MGAVRIEISYLLLNHYYKYKLSGHTQTVSKPSASELKLCDLIRKSIVDSEGVFNVAEVQLNP